MESFQDLKLVSLGPLDPIKSIRGQIESKARVEEEKEEEGEGHFALADIGKKKKREMNKEELHVASCKKQHVDDMHLSCNVSHSHSKKHNMRKQALIADLRDSDRSVSDVSG